ncbi:MAG: hypothetical protein J6K85_04295 [Clostridia bacterium]|nr:hypothetical protein [Clostridia bacterium]
MAFKKSNTRSIVSRPSSVIEKNRYTTFSLASPKAKSISYQAENKNGKVVSRYIPNTKANRDLINKLKGKPDNYGSRKIWW